MVSSSLVSRRLKTICIFKPLEGDPEYTSVRFLYMLHRLLYNMITLNLVVECAVLDVVLGELSVVRERHKLHAGHKLHIALGKCLQL